MKNRKHGTQTTSRAGLFVRVVFALVAGGAFAYLAWEPERGRPAANVKSAALPAEEAAGSRFGNDAGE